MAPVQTFDPSVAYFSMEIGLESDIPTYSGGLGVLAGDTLRAAADLAVPLVAVSLVHRKGYFRQGLDAEGVQKDAPADWSPEKRLEELPERVRLTLGGRDVHVRGWRYTVRGVDGDPVPVYLLDTDLPENGPDERRITNRLYGGDQRDRLRQEAVLGLAGPAFLRAMGHRKIHTFHMNEGHAALLPLALIEERLGGDAPAAADQKVLDAVRRLCVFTTHTPVPAGHDRFPADLAGKVLGAERAEAALRWGGEESGELNMSRLALSLARYVNGVALRHGQVSREMFPGHEIDAITNGVHVGTWAGDAVAALFDRHLPRWRREPERLRHAVALPLDELVEAHREQKKALLREVESRGGPALDPDVFTVGFARRATAYKRADLLFTDPERLQRIARERGALQVLYAGKAHPRDEAGQEMIRRVFQGARELEGSGVRVVYVPGYDMTLGRFMTAGVDLWLNNPERPKEASGTSGMKAALNGVPNLSVLDGWWIEGHVEGVTGWSIGERWDVPSDSGKDAAALYRKLEKGILPMYYDKPDAYARVRRYSIALNGSHFSARRMVLQYLDAAYRPPED